MENPTHFTAKITFDPDTLRFCQLIAKILLRAAREQKENSGEKATEESIDLKCCESKPHPK